jgi:hypothetical protein
VKRKLAARSIPVERTLDSVIACDVCGRPATVVRPATANRELAYYCDYDARLGLGWGDSYRTMTPEEQRGL